MFYPLYGSSLSLSATAVDSAHARSAANDAARASATQADRLDRALLACEAMWMIMREKLNVSDEELVKRINDLDLTDGRLDGKVRKSGAVRCPNCDRTIASRFSKCMYCGQQIVQDPFA